MLRLNPSTPLPLFTAYPDNSIVRNQRTGENVLVRPPQRPAEIVRGVGPVGPLPVRADDEWLLIPTVEIVASCQ